MHRGQLASCHHISEAFCLLERQSDTTRASCRSKFPPGLLSGSAQKGRKGGLNILAFQPRLTRRQRSSWLGCRQAPGASTLPCAPASPAQASRQRSDPPTHRHALIAPCDWSAPHRLAARYTSARGSVLLSDAESSPGDGKERVLMTWDVL